MAAWPSRARSGVAVAGATVSIHASERLAFVLMHVKENTHAWAVFPPVQRVPADSVAAWAVRDIRGDRSLPCRAPAYPRCPG